MSSRIYDRHVENCAQAGTTREQTDQNFVKKKKKKKKADENSRNQKMEQHHLNEKMKLFTGAILNVAKETIPRGKRRDYIPGWNAQLQEHHSTACRLREKMKFCPTDDNIAASTKPKQNLPDRSSNRHALPGMKKTSSQHVKKYGQVVEAH